MSNPIHKEPTKGWAYSNGRGRRGKSWAFTCPICLETKGESWSYYVTTRKTAKDALHQHMKHNHPGTGVDST